MNNLTTKEQEYLNNSGKHSLVTIESEHGYKISNFPCDTTVDAVDRFLWVFNCKTFNIKSIQVNGKKLADEYVVDFQSYINKASK